MLPWLLLVVALPLLLAGPGSCEPPRQQRALTLLGFTPRLRRPPAQPAASAPLARVCSILPNLSCPPVRDGLLHLLVRLLPLAAVPAAQTAVQRARLHCFHDLLDVPAAHINMQKAAPRDCCLCSIVFARALKTRRGGALCVPAPAPHLMALSGLSLPGSSRPVCVAGAGQRGSHTFKRRACAARHGQVWWDRSRPARWDAWSLGRSTPDRTKQLRQRSHGPVVSSACARERVAEV